MRVVASHFSLRDVNFDLLSFILHTKQYYNNSYRWDPFSFHSPRGSARLPQRRRARILHTLIHPHQLLPGLLCNRNKLRYITNRRIIQIMHHHKIPPLINVALEIRDLVFRRGAQGPQPILHVDTPFDEL
jgi:hypothetical protein